VVTDPLQDKTIADFGEQWLAYTDNRGYYASRDLLDDVFGPLVDLSSLAGTRIAEVGAGTGRFVQLFAAAGARHIVAVEPSRAIDVLRRNTAAHRERITYLHEPGDRLPATGDLDYAFSIGVLHHIPNPAPVITAMFRALRPGGRCAIWVYGQEGNRVYLAALGAVLSLTRRLPHGLLAVVVWLVYWPAACYMHACRWLPLPMARYMREVWLRFDPATRRLVLYDQLNPAYAKYYTQSEVRQLMEAGGFVDVVLHHRHGYSWSAVGRKPDQPA
jgi:SAM-dependent methyltransferase